MEMSSVLPQSQEWQFSGCGGSLNFFKYFILLSIKNPRLCTKFLLFLMQAEARKERDIKRIIGLLVTALNKERQAIAYMKQALILFN